MYCAVEHFLPHHGGTIALFDVSLEPDLAHGAAPPRGGGGGDLTSGLVPAEVRIMRSAGGEESESERSKRPGGGLEGWGEGSEGRGESEGASWTAKQ
eukprot:2554501-Pyramimonas_sp.AAC.1